MYIYIYGSFRNSKTPNIVPYSRILIKKPQNTVPLFSETPIWVFVKVSTGALQRFDETVRGERRSVSSPKGSYVLLWDT